jgi:hypothetical protein
LLQIRLDALGGQSLLLHESAAKNLMTVGNYLAQQHVRPVPKTHLFRVSCAAILLLRIEMKHFCATIEKCFYNKSRRTLSCCINFGGYDEFLKNALIHGEFEITKEGKL